MLPQVALAPLIFWLRELGADSAQRSQIARQTLEGALRSVAERMQTICQAQQEQEETHQRLLAAVNQSYRQGQSSIIDSTQDGALLRGEVLARWQDFVGTGEFFRSIEAGIGRIRDRISSFFKGQPSQAIEVEQALEVGLHSIIIEQAAQAAENTQGLWLEEKAGRALLAGRDLGQLDEDFPEYVAQGIRDWQQDLLTMISQEGASKRQRARFMSLGVNAAAVILMVAVFSMTGGLTGLEVGIAGGSGVVGTKLLEAVFGEDAVRRMAQGARRNLETRIQELLDQHSSLFKDILATVELGPPSGQLDQDRQLLADLARSLKGVKHD